MQVIFGNSAPHECIHDDNGEHTGHRAIPGPALTYVSVPDSYSFEPTDSDTPESIALHLLQAQDGITRLGHLGALMPFVHPSGFWPHHSTASPDFVWSDNPELAKMIGAVLGISVLSDLAGTEDQYHTYAGPPGVVPGAKLDLDMLKVNSGNDIQSRQMGGGQVGYAGTAGSGGSSPTSTTLTDSGSPGWTSNQWAGYRVTCGTVWGQIVSNTSSVLTVDRWNNFATPGGSAGTTPSASATYGIQDGTGPAWFIGLTANTGPPASGDTSLSGEITTSGGGLVRKIAPYAHTASASSFTLTPVYTANGSDSLPVTIAMIGGFITMVVSNTTSTMLNETSLNATATLSASGDQLTITLTWSL